MAGIGLNNGIAQIRQSLRQHSPQAATLEVLAEAERYIQQLQQKYDEKVQLNKRQLGKLLLKLQELKKNLQGIDPYELESLITMLQDLVNTTQDPKLHAILQKLINLRDSAKKSRRIIQQISGLY